VSPVASGVAAVRCRLVSIGAGKAGLLRLTVALRQRAVQLLRLLSRLAVDGDRCLDAHCEVLKERVAAYQAPRPQQVLVSCPWNDERG